MITINRNNPTPGEITSSLTNSTDAAGLHFDGVAGNIDIASPPDLGTKFSFEFILQADSWGESGGDYLVDFGSSGRFAFRSHTDDSFDLGIYDGSTHSFGVKVLDDLKVHHLVVTVDGTAAILYDNGNQVGTTSISTPTIDLAADARIGSNYNGGASWFDGTIYRARLWNKTLSQAEVTASYENATVPTADRWGSPTSIVAGWDFTSGWSIASGTVDDLNSFTSSGISGVVKNYGLTIGDVYTVTIAGSTTAAGFNFTNSSGAGTGLIGGFGTHVFTAVNASIYLRNGGTGTTDITTLELHKAGVVADYDLAFANPTQSTMVQDRAGAADGTASAGVTQVTPIEQLNSKSARIGNSQATPADGDLLVSGNVGVGASSFDGFYGNLQLGDTSTASSALNLFNSTTGTGGILFADGTSGDDRVRGRIEYKHTTNSLHFRTDAAERLTIDSTGLATFSAGIVSSAMPTSDPSVAGQLWNDSGTVKISSG